ncbi:MAG: efflux RND transporter periplasmic adaptor subunit [Phycisphaeraceae bacterium]|nr:efflux RND transporter periplasmic adaptor subunit [Phycisphaeraceae bacterium]
MWAVVLALAILLGWRVWRKLNVTTQDSRRQQPVPVAVAAVEHGPIELRRTFSGTLEARAAFDVAAKISGRVESIDLDIGDGVERGQVVAELDSDEYQQAVALAEAELAVAQATLAEAQSQLEIAQREYDRVRTLSERGVASESRLDTVLAEQATADAASRVAAAQVRKAEAALATARIRLGYTRVTVTWSAGEGERIVAERFVDAGDSVSANQPLLSIVEIDPLVGVIYVTESDYGQLASGLEATLSADAYPGRTFSAQVHRISPVFRAASRQARVELLVDNQQQALKPGMFIRATIVLDRAENAVIVPQSALTRRNDAYGVFLLSADGGQVNWQPVRMGIRDGDRVQVIADNLHDYRGHVVTLGQQLIDDESKIVVSKPDDAVGAPLDSAPTSLRSAR